MRGEKKEEEEVKARKFGCSARRRHAVIGSAEGLGCHCKEEYIKKIEENIKSALECSMFQLSIVKCYSGLFIIRLAVLLSLQS